MDKELKLDWIASNYRKHEKTFQKAVSTLSPGPFYIHERSLVCGTTPIGGDTPRIVAEYKTDVLEFDFKIAKDPRRNVFWVCIFHDGELIAKSFAFSMMES